MLVTVCRRWAEPPESSVVGRTSCPYLPTLPRAVARRPRPSSHDRTHYLYIAVIVAVVAGVTVGLVWPALGVALRPIGTAFVNLIKMIISPVIFCTIVLGIGSIREAAKVGKVGSLALLYFVVMSTSR